MKIIWLSIIFMAFSMSSFGQQNAENLNLADDGVALQGYDPISYFNSDEPKEGDSTIIYTKGGATYYFSNEENRAMFKNSPDKYKPAYGGWCAYAMGDDGSKVKIDPETYKIIEGELYLFYHTFWNNTLPDWNDNEAELKSKADKNWDNLITNN